MGNHLILLMLKGMAYGLAAGAVAGLVIFGAFAGYYALATGG